MAEVEEEVIEVIEDNEEVTETLETDEDIEVLEDDIEEEIEEVIEEVEEKPIEKKEVKQTPEDNAKYAAARRKAEDDHKKSMEAVNEALSRVGISSVSELMKSKPVMTDAKRAKLEDIALERGEDPEDYVEKIENREYVKWQRAKEEVQELEVQRKDAAQAKVNSDKQEFTKTYPTVKVDDLLKDEYFMEFAEGKLGNKPLNDIYKSFLKITGNARNISKQKSTSKANRSTSVSGGGKPIVLRKSQKEALDTWNRENPNNKMTAKEMAE